MDILQMTYFRDAARLENFSLVAKKNYVAQSSVSRAIARMEEEFGVKLFNRNGNTVTLNEYGRLLLGEVESALLHIENASRLLANRQSNILRVQTVAGTAATVPMMAAFRAAHPEIELQFPASNTPTYIPDLMLSTKPHTDADRYRYVRLFTERVVIALPKDSPLAAREALSVDDLHGYPVVGLQHGDAMYNWMREYFEAHRYTPSFVAVTSNPTTVAEYVKYGFGISFFPEKTWSLVMQNGVAVRPFSDVKLERSIYLYWDKETAISPAMQKFIDFCTAYYAEEK